MLQPDRRHVASPTPGRPSGTTASQKGYKVGSANLACTWHAFCKHAAAAPDQIHQTSAAEHPSPANDLTPTLLQPTALPALPCLFVSVCAAKHMRRPRGHTNSRNTADKRSPTVWQTEQLRRARRQAAERKSSTASCALRCSQVLKLGPPCVVPGHKGSDECHVILFPGFHARAGECKHGACRRFGQTHFFEHRFQRHPPLLHPVP